MKKNCRKFHKWLTSKEQGANPTKADDDFLLVPTQALTTVFKGGWIVDSGTTCQMSNEESSFCEIKQLSAPQDVTLGDGRTLKGTAIGTSKS